MKLALLGRHESLYTRMMLVEFRKAGLSFECILLEKGKLPATTGQGAAFRNAIRLLTVMSSGALQSLPIWHWYYWRRLTQLLLSRRSTRGKELFCEYTEPSFDSLISGVAPIMVADVNDARGYLALKEAAVDVGVLGGVGIVSNPILSTFRQYCLNAHPGPLPECRGSGAIEQALSRGLVPMVSVHFVEKQIDAGRILDRLPVTIESKDDFYSLDQKLSVLSAQAMARVVSRLARSEVWPHLENSGPLHRWRDCTLAIHQKAERQLRTMRRSV